jgi:hypothetical protein
VREGPQVGLHTNGLTGVLGGRLGRIGTAQMFLVEPRGQSYRELWSEDWWAQSEHEAYGA